MRFGQGDQRSFVTLPKNSVFGEYYVLFDKNSDFIYTTVSSMEDTNVDCRVKAMRKKNPKKET